MNGWYVRIWLWVWSLRGHVGSSKRLVTAWDSVRWMWWEGGGDLGSWSICLASAQEKRGSEPVPFSQNLLSVKGLWGCGPQVIRKAATELHSCAWILKWPVRVSLCEETFVKRLIVRNRLGNFAFDLAFQFYMFFLLFSNLKSAPNRCHDTQRFICLTDHKLFLLGPPQPHFQ